jgi:phage terminase Nu1 subunit (DNA packaging protein)
MVDEEDLFRLALYQARHALAMARAEHQHLENQQVKGSLQKGDAVVWILLGSHPT